MCLDVWAVVRQRHRPSEISHVSVVDVGNRLEVLSGGKKGIKLFCGKNS